MIVSIQLSSPALQSQVIVIPTQLPVGTALPTSRFSRPVAQWLWNFGAAGTSALIGQDTFAAGAMVFGAAMPFAGSLVTGAQAINACNTGLRAGAIFCAISLVLNAVLKNAVYQHFGLSAVNVIVLYLAGGTIIGIIVGPLRSVVTGPVSASLVAVTALMPAIAIARVSPHGVGNWRWGELIGFLIVSLFLGGLWGPFFWKAHRDHDEV